MKREAVTGCCAAIAMVGWFQADAAADELVLVEDGASLAPVVVFQDAPPKTLRAVEELVDYIEKISGARPELIEGAPDPVPEHAIWVGYQPVLDELFPEVDFDFEHPEEILIAANDSHLVIAGRDRWDPDTMSRPSRMDQTIEGAQDEYGTVNAIYTFLQEYLGVRWLWPGEAGLDIIESDRLAFEPFEYRYHPQIRNRDMMLRFTSLEWSVAPDFGDWARFSRLQLDSMSAPLQGHGFGDWWERFSDEHPEYFALQPDGTRSGFPNPGAAKMCQSNPDVWERWVDEVEKALEEDPSRRMFSGAPNDSWHRGHCVCEACRAWDHPDGELGSFSWQGVVQNYVALSDRHVTFANMLGRKLKERFPDQDLYVTTFAYGHSRPAPLEAVPDDNVIIASVANFFGLRTDYLGSERSAGGTTKFREQFAAWGEVAPNLMWRPNTGNPAGWRAGNPIIPLEQTMEDFRLLAEAGCIGIHIDYVWLFWATQGPLYYLMAQLAWNPHADGHALMEEYFERAYGPAVATVRAYWELVEANPGLLTDELMAQAWELLDQAETEVAGAPEKYQDRVEFTRKGLEYVGLVRKGQALMKAYEESQGQDQAAAERARENWQEILRMHDENPNLFRRGSVANRRDQPSGNLANVHPDY